MASRRIKSRFRDEHAVSTNRSPPTYTFSHSKRELFRTNDAPGPGAYFAGPPPKKNLRATFPRSSRNLEFGRPQCGAPVGAYDVPSTLSSSLPHTSRRKTMPPSAVFSLPKGKPREGFSTPGPGAYNPRPATSGGFVGLSKRTSDMSKDHPHRATYLDQVIRSEQSKPPVGAYMNNAPATEKKQGGSPSRIFRLPEGKRRVPASDVLAAPGAYTPKPVLPSDPVYSFQGKKEVEVKPSGAPDPGAYNPVPVGAHVPTLKFSERRIPEVRADGPTPASYNPSVDAVKQAPPVYTFRSRGKTFPDAVSEKYADNPDPAAYMPKANGKHVPVLTFTERRIPQPKSTSPPPGAYNPKLPPPAVPHALPFSERRMPQVASSTPGPGAYDSGGFAFKADASVV